MVPVALASMGLDKHWLLALGIFFHTCATGCVFSDSVENQYFSQERNERQIQFWV